MECKEAQNYLMSLDAHKDKEDYQKHLGMYTTHLSKKREEGGKSINICFMLKRKHMHVVSFGEI